MRLPAIAVVTGVALLGFASWAFADDDEKGKGGKEQAAKEQKVDVDDVPKAVTKAVKAKFPNAKVQGAGKEEEDGETFYELNLKNGEQTVDVLVEDDGEIVEIETTIDADDLPAAVRKAIKAKYAGAKIKRAEKVVTLEEDEEEEGDAGEKAGKDDDDDGAAAKKGGSKKAGDDEGDDEDEDEDEKGSKGKEDADDDDEDDGDVAYEVILTTDGGKTIEVKFSPDGKKAVEDEDNEEEDEKGGEKK